MAHGGWIDLGLVVLPVMHALAVCLQRAPWQAPRTTFRQAPLAGPLDFKLSTAQVLQKAMDGCASAFDHSAGPSAGQEGPYR